MKSHTYIDMVPTKVIRRDSTTVARRYHALPLAQTWKSATNPVVTWQLEKGD